MTEYAEVYVADSKPVVARGLQCPAEQMDEVISAIKARVVDAEGKETIRRLLEEAAATEFALARVAEILERELPIEDWRAGEGLAESYLEEHRGCQFPWPALRDLRNWRASGAGADLVGLHLTAGGLRLAFGEVKTSTEERWPPGVMSGRTGMIHQLEDLRDSATTQEALLRYLALRAKGEDWQAAFQEAAGQYLDDPKNLSLFGVLVRDVAPNPDDLAARAKSLASGVNEPTSVYLAAIYLPAATIVNLPTRLHEQGPQA